MSNENQFQGRRILVVEDDFYLATDHAAILEQSGARIVACTGDAEEAAGLIERMPIDCAIVDINLGAGPAYDTARKLRDGNIPFLFATGYDARAIPPEFGDIVRVEKPFDRKKLLGALERILEPLGRAQL